MKAVTRRIRRSVVWACRQARGFSSTAGLNPWGLVLSLVALGTVGATAQSVATFQLRELFGVSHPDQVIDFDLPAALPAGTGYYFTDSSGNEYPAQMLKSENKVALRLLGGLPAGGQKQLQLFRGASSQSVLNPVVVDNSRRDYLEMHNGLTGVRVVKPTAPIAQVLAPIQGIRLKDGTWTATGPNLLYQFGMTNNRVLASTNVTLTLVEEGPLKTVVEVRYLFNRVPWAYPGGCTSHRPPECLYYPPGQGYFKSTLTLLAGQPSILIEDHTDMELQYYVNLHDAVRPNQGRYRGHHATSVETGREPDRQPYRQSHMRPPMDAVRDFDYTVPIFPSHLSASYASYKLLPRMTAWNPWAYDTGWYWMLYNSNDGGAAPVVGAFMGRASRAVGAHASGVGLYLMPDDGFGRRAMGFCINSAHLAADMRYLPEHRFSWGLFVGDQANDLSAPTNYQAIARQMNLHGGISLNKLHRQVTTFDDADHRYGAMFMEADVLAGMISRLQAGGGAKLANPYYEYLYNAEPTARPLVGAWADADGRAAMSAARDVFTQAQTLLQAYVNQDGTYDLLYAYWSGGLAMQNATIAIDSLLSYPRWAQVDRDGSIRAQLKAVGVLYAYLAFDGDLVPIDNWATNLLPLGTANMPAQYVGLRNTSVAAFPGHPFLRERRAGLRDAILGTTRGLLNEAGANFSSPHYVLASLGPTLNNLQQLRMIAQQTREEDPFVAEPRLARFAEFLMQLHTPPEPRFGNRRKLVASGDGSTEGSHLAGQLGTGFRSANPALSARLMGAWQQGGKVHSGFHGSSLLMIDESLPTQDPRLGCDRFAGYMSVLRHGPSAGQETALWLFDGDFHSDHRNDDRGSLVAYALGAPLSINFGSMYYPHLGSGSMKNMVMPEANFPSWNDPASQPIDTHQSGWLRSTNLLFTDFVHSSMSAARMESSNQVWLRQLVCLHPDSRFPLVLVRDQFAGADAAQPKVLSFNLMADGGVATPTGQVAPLARLNTAKDGSVNAVPSASPVFTLAAGLHRFSFTGQVWPAHPNRGIDWDFYASSPAPLSGCLSQWGHVWHPSVEMDQFQKTNGMSFEERQHILRLRSPGPFTSLIVPWNKGQRPADYQVTQNGNSLVLRLAGQHVEIGDGFYVFTNAQRKVLTTFDERPFSAAGIATSGGPLEIEVEPARAVVTLHGAKGQRRVRLPVALKVVQVTGDLRPPAIELNELVFNYDSDKPVSVVLE